MDPRSGRTQLLAVSRMCSPSSAPSSSSLLHPTPQSPNSPSATTMFPDRRPGIPSPGSDCLPRPQRPDSRRVPLPASRCESICPVGLQALEGSAVPCWVPPRVSRREHPTPATQPINTQAVSKVTGGRTGMNLSFDHHLKRTGVLPSPFGYPSCPSARRCVSQ